MKCLAGLLGLLILPAAAAAQAADVLAGLRVVDVRVRLEGAARAYPGLDAAALRAGISARLEAGGLRVLDVTSAGQAPIFEALVVMYADSGRARRYAFSVSATLTEGVVLRRGAPPRVWAQTWNGGSTVGITGVNGAEPLVTDVLEMVERFLRDYSNANSKGKRAGFTLPSSPFPLPREGTLFPLPREGTLFPLPREAAGSA